MEPVLFLHLSECPSCLLAALFELSPAPVLGPIARHPSTIRAFQLHRPASLGDRFVGLTELYGREQNEGDWASLAPVPVAQPHRTDLRIGPC